MTSLETPASGAGVLACGASGIETLTLASQRNGKYSRELPILTRKGIAMPVVRAAAVPLSPVLYSREGTIEKVVGKIREWRIPEPTAACRNPSLLHS
jgi:hypothetical protein